MIQINHKVGVCALFKLQAVNAKTGESRELTDWFPNLVLDAGLARMSVGAWVTGVNVGTGNSIPVATQTSLDNFLARTTAVYSSGLSRQTAVAPYYYKLNTTWRFGEGVAAGNLSEIALGWSNSECWNRALIKDTNGNPTTITVLSNEYLDVAVELRIYPAEESTFTLDLLDDIDGAIISTHTVTLRPSMTRDLQRLGGVDSLSAGRIYPHHTLTTSNSLQNPEIRTGTLNNIITAPSGATLSASHAMSAHSFPTPTSMSVQRTAGVAENNGSQRSLVFFSTIGDYKCEYNPPLVKNNTQTMRHAWTLSWGRYEPT